ncbi:MAG TPA: hypothetical protein VGO86_19050 [Candidatus Dormibacteraeota bacterium]
MWAAAAPANQSRSRPAAGSTPASARGQPSSRKSPIPSRSASRSPGGTRRARPYPDRTLGRLPDVLASSGRPVRTACAAAIENGSPAVPWPALGCSTRSACRIADQLAAGG